MPVQFNIPKEQRSIIKVIGVGGGGSNAVNYMYKQGIVGVDFAICNTDNQSLELSPVPTKIQLGPSLTEGRGAGSKPEIGKQACLESLDEIKSFLDDGTKMLFVTAGMGGGTGTGAAPILAELARDMGILTVGIVTLPFDFEGGRRNNFAHEGIQALKQNVDALIVISNNKLREIHGDLILSEAFGKIDNILTTAAKGIAEIITVAGIINVDFEDVNTVMRNSGVALMGTATAEGQDRALEAVNGALNYPLLEENDISGAKHILLNITYGKDQITMAEVSKITEVIKNRAGFDTDLIWGTCQEESLGDQISVTVIATGFEPQSPKLAVKEEPKVLENEVPKEEDQSYAKENSEALQSETIPYQNHQGPFEIEWTTEEVVEEDETSATSELNTTHRDLFSKEAKDMYLLSKRYSKQTNKKITLLPDLINIEMEPAFKRRQVALENIGNSNEDLGSQWKYDPKEERVIKENRFLHNNVD
jgi:cell division protein FtsZ